MWSPTISFISCLCLIPFVTGMCGTGACMFIVCLEDFSCSFCHQWNKQGLPPKLLSLLHDSPKCNGEMFFMKVQMKRNIFLSLFTRSMITKAHLGEVWLQSWQFGSSVETVEENLHYIWLIKIQFQFKDYTIDAKETRQRVGFSLLSIYQVLWQSPFCFDSSIR